MAKKDVEVMDTEEEKEGGSKIVTILVTLVIILKIGRAHV